MAIDPTSLEDVSEEEVIERKQILRDIVNTDHPDLSLEEGTVNQQIILQPNAEIDALQQLSIDRYRQSSSLQAISENPALADDELVDNVLSNFFVERRPGTVSVGAITMVFDAAATYAIPTTTTFTVGDRVFNPISDFTLVTNANLTLPDSILLRQRADGNWWASVPVEDTIIGGEIIAKGTVFVVAPAPGNLVSASATNDFTPGTNAETNEEVTDRLEEGTAMKSVGDRKAIAAVIKDEFPTVTDISSIGIGDDESVRDARQLLGISLGGRGDLYHRSAPTANRVRVTVLGVFTGNETLLTDFDIEGYYRDYRISLDVDAIAAFYRVAALTYMNPANSASDIEFDYSFTEGASVTGYDEVSRGIRSVDEEFSPDINDPQQAVYTRYQGTVVIDISNDLPTVNYQQVFDDLVEGFSATDTLPVAVGGGEIQLLTIAEIEALVADDTRRIYDVYVDIMPEINDIQDFLNDRDNRPPGSDYLVKAATPCFTGATLNVLYAASGTVPDTQAIQEAVADAVNALPIGTQSLSILTITAAAQAVLPSGAVITLPAEVIGLVRLPDGTNVLLSSSSEITLPERVEQGVTARTTIFLLRPDDVTVTLETT